MRKKPREKHTKSRKTPATKPYTKKQAQGQIASPPQSQQQNRRDRNDFNKNAPNKNDKEAMRSGSALQCPKGKIMIWGRHATVAALANPLRKIEGVYLSHDAAKWFSTLKHASSLPVPVVMEKPMLTRALSPHLPGGEDKAVHQGIVIIAAPLEPPALEEWLEEWLEAELPARPLVVLLDQITDGRNIGAMMRSAWAFGASAVIATEHHSPLEGSTILRAASGAAEHIPLIRVVNLARAMETLQGHGFTLAGMAVEGDADIDVLAHEERLGIVMGAEGKGLRRLTRERADMLVRIPIEAGAGSLNVSVATAVALFAAGRTRTAD